MPPLGKSPVDAAHRGVQDGPSRHEGQRGVARPSMSPAQHRGRPSPAPFGAQAVDKGLCTLTHYSTSRVAAGGGRLDVAAMGRPGQHLRCRLARGTSRGHHQDSAPRQQRIGSWWRELRLPVVVSTTGGGLPRTLGGGPALGAGSGHSGACSSCRQYMGGEGPVPGHRQRQFRAPA